MSHLTDNDLKTKGVAAIEAMLEQHSEAIVSVRGKDRFVVMDIAQYHYLQTPGSHLVSCISRERRVKQC